MATSRSDGDRQHGDLSVGAEGCLPSGGLAGALRPTILVPADAEPDEVAAALAAVQMLVQEVECSQGSHGPARSLWRLAGRLEAQGLPVEREALDWRWRG